MSKGMPKFYDMETITQEKLNNLALERNTLEKENERLKNLEYKFFDDCGDEECFTLNDYLELGNKLYDLQEENKRLNNIINEFDKWLEEKDKYSTTLKPTIYIGKIQTKLQELKEKR